MEACDAMPQTIRFAVGNVDDVRSSIWRLWANKADVYLGARTTLGAMKISLHASGICRAAVVSPTPRPPLAKWKRPPTTAPGFTRLFSVVVPPYLVTGPFTQVSNEKKLVCFVPAPTSTQHKLVFTISVADPLYTAQNILDIPRDRPISIIGNIPIKDGTLWLFWYYDDFRQEERSLIQGYVKGFRIHLEPGVPFDGTRAASLHWFDTNNPQPHVVDIRLGIENETFDPPRGSG